MYHTLSPKLSFLLKTSEKRNIETDKNGRYVKLFYWFLSFLFAVAGKVSKLTTAINYRQVKSVFEISDALDSKPP